MAMQLKLTIDADTSHEDARDWYSAYGWHLPTEHGGDVCHDAVEYDWLDDDDDVVVKKLMASRAHLRRSEAEGIVSAARSIREAAEELEALLGDAVDAYEAGDVEACITALDAAEALESDHGDTPASSALRNELLVESEEEEEAEE